jgi:hypothetical protein
MLIIVCLSRLWLSVHLIGEKEGGYTSDIKEILCAVRTHTTLDDRVKVRFTVSYIPMYYTVLPTVSWGRRFQCVD